MSLILCVMYGGNNQVLDLAYRYTPFIEPLDNGSAFLDLSSGGLPDLFREWAGAVSGEMPVAGAGANPLVAKAALLAGRSGRRRGLRVQCYAGGVVYRVPSGGESAFMAGLPVTMLWPIPDRTRRKLLALGLSAIGDVARAGEQVLVTHCGPLGCLIASYARGKDGRRVEALYPPLSLSWHRDLTACTSVEVLREALAEGARDLAQQLRGRGTGCRRLELFLSIGGRPPLSAVQETTGLPPEPGRLYSRLSLLLSGLELHGEVTGVRIGAAGLYPLAPRQVDLFSLRPAVEQENLDRAVDAVDRKHPGCLVRARALLPGLRRERALSCYDPWRSGQRSPGWDGEERWLRHAPVD